MASQKHAKQGGIADRLDDGTWTRKSAAGLNYGQETIRKKNKSDSSKDLHPRTEKQLLRVEELTFTEYLPGSVPPPKCFSLGYLVNYRKLTPLEYGFY